MTIKRTSFIDETTGVVICEETKSINYFGEDGYLLFAKKNHSRVFSDIRIPDCFTDSDLGKIYRLQANIQYETNMLVVRKSAGYKPMTADEIMNKVGLRDRQGRTFIKKLIENGVMARVTVECAGTEQLQYYFNPLYFHNGRNLSVGLYNIFKDQIDPHLKDWVKWRYSELTESGESECDMKSFLSR